MRVVSYTIRKLEHVEIETLGYIAPVWVDAVKLPGGVIYHPEDAEGLIRENVGVVTKPTTFILVAQSSNGREDIIGGEVQLNP